MADGFNDIKEIKMTTVLSTHVPPKLQEILSDHPALIQEIHDGLDRLAAAPLKGTPVFEQAVWLLEDTLSRFVESARADLTAAESTGNADAIEKAQSKVAATVKAKPKHVWLMGLDEFEQSAARRSSGGAA
jgi:hypothetical protein